jgi:hypothetical protein
MNDQKWFNKEPSYFDTLVNVWNNNFLKSDMYQKVFVNSFDINRVNIKSVPQIKPISR